MQVDWCEEDCMTMRMKKDDGTTVVVGIKDYGFKVPKDIIGKRINAEGVVPGTLILKDEKVERVPERHSDCCYRRESSFHTKKIIHCCLY